MPGTLRAARAKRIKLRLLQGFISFAICATLTCKCNRRIGLQYRPRALIELSRNYKLPISWTNVFAGLTAFRDAIMSIAVPYPATFAKLMMYSSLDLARVVQRFSKF